MGFSTDGQLTYGVSFEEGHEFPWDAEEFDGCEYSWWNKVGPEGTRIPVEIVGHCSYDYRMIIIGIKGYHHYNNRGYAVEIKPQDITINASDLETFNKFFEDYKIKKPSEPKWWLTSMMG